ncbi:hypothetical protein BB561_006082 [Smittium simulii]|uniref:Pyroglutamyl-peptidase I n=1 Tax=Smittium simulii TaxID=133385 RepID=A0A2T9Y6Q6_9FUNG|nr:hypothetical protein BB561_006082 [Smittium simulii]
MKFRVLITGFEPFGVPVRPKNRSWEVAKLVERLHKSNSLRLDPRKASQSYTDGPPRDIEITIRQLPVEYEKARTLLEELHQVAEPEAVSSYDLFLHIGEGRPDLVQLETRAYRKNYLRAGNGGPADLPLNNEISGYTDEVVYPTTDIQQLVSTLNSSLAYKYVFTSNDAGRYLCEYTFYLSTAMCNKYNTTHPGSNQTALFMHLPPDNGPYTDEQLAVLVHHIINLV